ncbi:MAG: hypothetical protein FJ276_27050 [Planctomycetes bacterium]|nr:hypothetical protein [Planctomycetota bacterium]
MITVVGDIIVDKYLYCRTRRRNPEHDRGYAYQVSSVKHRCGGASAVAMICRKMDCEVALCGVVGDDPAGRWLRRTIRAHGIRDHVWVDLDCRTVIKQRVVYGLAVLEDRIDFDDQYAALEASDIPVANNGIIVVSDYGKGTVSPALMAHLQRKAARVNARILVDPAKCSDWRKYAPCELIKCNRSQATRVLAELGVAVGDDHDAASIVQTLDESLPHDMLIRSLVVTDGPHGVAWKYRRDAIAHSARSTLPITPIDVCGAGDTVIATLAAAFGRGWSLPDACAAAIRTATAQVQTIGIGPVPLPERFTRTLTKAQ